MKINLAESLTGFERIIKHLDGRNVLIKHPPDQPIRPDSFKRVSKQGMISMETHHTGDLIVHFDVEFPPANFFNNPSLIKNLEALLPAKSSITIPTGTNLDEASSMTECHQRPHSSPIAKDDDEDDDDQYMDEDDDDDEDEDGLPHVHSCHNQ